MNSTKYQEIIALVKSQTNYSEDEIKEKLILHNNNYINVIKEYMGITNENSSYNKYNNEQPKTVNQGIFKNIREFMDNNIRQYEMREKIKQLRDNNAKNDNIQITESD